MTVIGLFLTSAALLATLWAGKVTLLDAVLIWTGVAVVTDLVAAITAFMRNFIANKNVEVLARNGLAQGIIEKGLRNQGWPTPRPKGRPSIPFLDGDKDKAD